MPARVVSLVAHRRQPLSSDDTIARPQPGAQPASHSLRVRLAVPNPPPGWPGAAGSAASAVRLTAAFGWLFMPTQTPPAQKTHRCVFSARLGARCCTLWYFGLADGEIGPQARRRFSFFVAHAAPMARLLLRGVVAPEQKPPVGRIGPRAGSGLRDWGGLRLWTHSNLCRYLEAKFVIEGSCVVR
jgi:hypothetical protein